MHRNISMQKYTNSYHLTTLILLFSSTYPKNFPQLTLRPPPSAQNKKSPPFFQLTSFSFVSSKNSWLFVNSFTPTFRESTISYPEFFSKSPWQKVYGTEIQNSNLLQERLRKWDFFKIKKNIWRYSDGGSRANWKKFFLFLFYECLKGAGRKIIWIEKNGWGERRE